MSETTDVDRATELLDAAFAWANSPAARRIALMLTPVLLPVVGAACFWLQDAFGIDMDPAVATAFVVSVVLGIAGVIGIFVLNHGRGAARALEVVAAAETQEPARPNTAED